MKKLIISIMICSASLVFASECSEKSAVLAEQNIAYDMINDISSISTSSNKTLIVNIDDIIITITNKEVSFNTSHEIKNHFYIKHGNRIVIDFEGKVDFNFMDIGLNIKVIDRLKFAQHQDFFRIVIQLKQQSTYDFVKIDNNKIFTIK